MHESILPGRVRRELTALDEYAILTLYEVGPAPQVSLLPCSEFVAESQWIEGKPQSVNCQCNLGVDCSCNEEERRVLSTDAERRLVHFVTGGDQFEFAPRNNLYRLQYEVIRNQDELVALATSNDPKLLPLKTAYADFHRIVQPLVEATFRCEKCPPSINLNIQQKHIDATVALLTEIRALNSSAALEGELKLLQNNLKYAKNKSLQQAAIDYDNAQLN